MEIKRNQIVNLDPSKHIMEYVIRFPLTESTFRVEHMTGEAEWKPTTTADEFADFIEAFAAKHNL